MKNILVIAFLAAFIPATASAEFYFDVEGAKQGKIKGESVKKGLENKLVGITVSHEVVSPRDPVSGLPTGKRQHKPYIITREVGIASPALFQAFVTNENLKTVTILFFRPSSRMAGQTELYYSVKLTNAAISLIHTAYKDDAQGAGRLVEDVAFTYQTIEMKNEITGTVATDDWSSP